MYAQTIFFLAGSRREHLLRSSRSLESSRAVLCSISSSTNTRRLKQLTIVQLAKSFLLPIHANTTSVGRLEHQIPETYIQLRGTLGVFPISVILAPASVEAPTLYVVFGDPRFQRNDLCSAEFSTASRQGVYSLECVPLYEFGIFVPRISFRRISPIQLRWR